MKTIRAIFLAIAVAVASTSSVRADAALDAFKKDMQSLETYTKEQEAALKDNPMGGIAMIRAMVGKIKAVKTDGLPADLKDSYAEVAAAFGKVGEMLKDLPDKADELTAYIQKKATEDPKFLADFGEKMNTLGQVIEPAMKKFAEVGKKYEIEGLEDLSK